MTPIDQDSQGSKINYFQGTINFGAQGQIKMDFPLYVQIAEKRPFLPVGSKNKTP